MATRKRTPRKTKLDKEEAAAPLAVKDKTPAETLHVSAVEPPPEPPIVPVEDRVWRTLGEVEAMGLATRQQITAMVANGWIANMQPGKQGTPQKWYPPHIWQLKELVDAYAAVRKLADMAAVAEAVNVDPMRTQNRVIISTTKGLRIVDEHTMLCALRNISAEPIIVYPQER